MHFTPVYSNSEGITAWLCYNNYVTRTHTYAHAHTIALMQHTDPQTLSHGMDWIHVARSQQLKMVLLGDSNVGKTCLVRLFIERRVVEHSSCTIGFDYYAKELQMQDDIPVKVCACSNCANSSLCGHVHV